MEPAAKRQKLAGYRSQVTASYRADASPPPTTAATPFDASSSGIITFTGRVLSLLPPGASNLPAAKALLAGPRNDLHTLLTYSNVEGGPQLAHALADARGQVVTITRLKKQGDDSTARGYNPAVTDAYKNTASATATITSTDTAVASFNILPHHLTDLTAASKFAINAVVFPYQAVDPPAANALDLSIPAAIAYKPTTSSDLPAIQHGNFQFHATDQRTIFRHLHQPNISRRALFVTDASRPVAGAPDIETRLSTGLLSIPHGNAVVDATLPFLRTYLKPASTTTASVTGLVVVCDQPILKT